MPDISSYQILRDPKISLGRLAHFRKEFTLPEDTNFRARSVLAFVADPTRGALLTLEIEVNGTVVKRAVFAEGDLASGPRAVWEVLGHNVLEEGDNDVRFTVLDEATIGATHFVASGKLGISDIVLWFTRTIPAVSRPRRPRAAPRRGRR
jgi:hypothetical protein